MAERIVPRDIEAEQSVIGAAFLSKYAVQKICEDLTSDMFYQSSHSKIFEAVYALNEKGIPLDIRTVSDELKNKGTLQEAGGIEYITEVMGLVPTATNVEYYVDIVRKNALKRKMIDTATKIADSGYSSTDPIEELLDNAEKSILDITKGGRTAEFKPMQEVLFRTQSIIEELSKRDGNLTGLTTGIEKLDSLTTGLHENEFIVIAARPAMGKTAFAVNLATNMSLKNNKSVALFNLEMGAEQLAMRMLGSIGNIDTNVLRTGKLDIENRKKLDESVAILADAKIFIDDTAGITVNDIRAKCRRLAASEANLGAIIIDYLQLIQGSSKYMGNRQQEVSEISRSLKMLAMELSVPVIAFSQLSRSVEGRDEKRPMLSDLRESGAIEQDADIVGFLYRDDYYYHGKEVNNTEASDSHSELIIAKHRSGETDTIELLFRKKYSLFMNYVKEENPELERLKKVFEKEADKPFRKAKFKQDGE